MTSAQTKGGMLSREVWPKSTCGEAFGGAAWSQNNIWNLSVSEADAPLVSGYVLAYFAAKLRDHGSTFGDLLLQGGTLDALAEFCAAEPDVPIAVAMEHMVPPPADIDGSKDPQNVNGFWDQDCGTVFPRGTTFDDHVLAGMLRHFVLGYWQGMGDTNAYSYAALVATEPASLQDLVAFCQANTGMSLTQAIAERLPSLQ